MQRFRRPARRGRVRSVTRPGRTVAAQRAFRLLAGLGAVTVTLLLAYLCARIAVAVAEPGQRPADRLLAFALLAAELFVAFHAVAFLSAMFRASRNAARVVPPAFAGHSSVPVAVLIAAYNESPQVLEETIA